MMRRSRLAATGSRTLRGARGAVPAALAGWLAIGAAAWGGAAQAAVVSGRVSNQMGTGIANVDLDFFDRDLGSIIFTPGDNTDALGYYAVSVPPSEYDILYNAPAGTPYLDLELRQVGIAGDTQIDVTLLVGHPVTGWVTDLAGAPLFNVDLDFVDSTGATLDTPNDNTDAAGHFSVSVPAGPYDIRFTPPAGQRYAGKELSPVVITAPTSLDTVRLDPAWFVTGVVRNQALAPVANADLDFEDVATGNKLFTPRDNSDAAGAFSVAVPAGTYHVLFHPPAGSGLAHHALFDTPVGGDLALGNVILPPGYALTGTVRNQAGAGLAGADLDMVDLTTGYDLPTDNDQTGPTGSFSMTGRADTIDLAVKPPPGMPLAARVLRSRVISGPTAFGTITLFAGFRIYGTVRDYAGTPLQGADLDATELSSGLPYPTPGDRSAADGSYSVRVMGGGYRFVMEPPAGLGLRPDTVTVSSVTSDMSIDFVLDPQVATSVNPPTAAQAGASMTLAQNVPNPFNPQTVIGFRVPSADAASSTPVRLRVYGADGRLLRTLVNERLPAGEHEARWDGNDDGGRPVPSGVYLYRLETEGGAESRKMVLLK